MFENLKKKKISTEYIKCYLRLYVLIVVISAFIHLLTLPISAEESENVWKYGYDWSKTSEFALVDDVTYSGDYSIRIKNSDYNDSYVEKTFSVKPYTRYKFSAKIKYADYIPEYNTASSGASIGISASYSHSAFITDGEWTNVEFVFETQNEQKISLCLRNGGYGALCKGTAWFSDIKLEECLSSKTNQWNILAVVFKNVCAPVTINGESYVYEDSLDEVDVDYLTGVLDNLYTTFDNISGGLMDVKDIDVFSSSKTVTELGRWSDGYCIDLNTKEVSEVLDYYLSQKTYNQIIVIAPVRDVAIGWAGLGGTNYYGTNICQINYSSRSDYPGNIKEFPDAVFVHEMLHCLETQSKGINPEKTPSLHGNAEFGYIEGGIEWIDWYTAYMRATLTGGKGLDPSVYWVYNDCVYTLVSDDMKVSEEIDIYGLITHKHSFPEKWSYNSSHHWHQCDGCEEITDYNKHIEDNGTITNQPDINVDGRKTFYCTVCDYVMRVEKVPALTTTTVTTKPVVEEKTTTTTATAIITTTSTTKTPESDKQPEKTTTAPITTIISSTNTTTSPNEEIKSDDNEELSDGITISLYNRLKKLSSGTPKVYTKKSYFDDSAIICLSHTDEAYDAALWAFEELGKGNSIAYAFDISIYDEYYNLNPYLFSGDYIRFSIPVPEEMAYISADIRVYHIENGYSEYIQSEIVYENGCTMVSFKANEFSPYMFIADEKNIATSDDEDMFEQKGESTTNKGPKNPNTGIAIAIIIPSTIVGCVALAKKPKRKRYKL